jgi:hypothetical protein
MFIFYNNYEFLLNVKAYCVTITVMTNNITSLLHKRLWQCHGYIEIYTIVSYNRIRVYFFDIKKIVSFFLGMPEMRGAKTFGFIYELLLI